MALTGRITVTSGPDRGKTFELSEELVRVGKGEENQLVLSDATAADFHLNILQREGRFAVLTQASEGVTVEGNQVPPDRWVWLPKTALIQLTRRTAIEFQSDEPSEPTNSGSPAAPEVVVAPEASTVALPNPQGLSSATATVAPKTRKTLAAVPAPFAETATTTQTKPTDGTESGDKLRRKKTASSDKTERKTVTARFITDGPGDPLVKLGEDGHLPELQLEDGRKRPATQQEAKRTNPVWVSLILLFGFGSSVLMLFVDIGEIGGSAHQKAEARQKLVNYYSDTKDGVKPYQLHLRQSQLARSRRDYDTERSEYRKVLLLLRSEGKNPYTGLTGTAEKDRELEEVLGVLLKD